MPSKIRRQTADALKVGTSEEFLAFQQIVNNGCVTFPNAYIRKRSDRYSTRVVLSLPLVFDRHCDDLHAEVYRVACQVADELLIAAALDKPLPKHMNTSAVLPGDHLFSETRAAEISSKQVIQQRTMNGVVQFRRDPENARQQAARTALWTVRDAVIALVETGAYRRLCRCRLESCRRLLFATKSQQLSYCPDRSCRQTAHRPTRTRGREVTRKGQLAS